MELGNQCVEGCWRRSRLGAETDPSWQRTVAVESWQDCPISSRWGRLPDPVEGATPFLDALIDLHWKYLLHLVARRPLVGSRAAPPAPKLLAGGQMLHHSYGPEPPLKPLTFLFGLYEYSSMGSFVSVCGSSHAQRAVTTSRVTLFLCLYAHPATRSVTIF